MLKYINSLYCCLTLKVNGLNSLHRFALEYYWALSDLFIPMNNRHQKHFVTRAWSLQKHRLWSVNVLECCWSAHKMYTRKFSNKKNSANEHLCIIVIPWHWCANTTSITVKHLHLHIVLCNWWWRHRVFYVRSHEVDVVERSIRSTIIHWGEAKATHQQWYCIIASSISSTLYHGNTS